MQQHIRILLVEDEALIAMSLEAELRQVGFQVCHRVGTGEEAIMAAREHHPDLILMDIRLAGNIDGIEAAQQIQASLPIPVIFMTGYMESSLRERAANLQPLGFLTKPLRLCDIQRALESLP